MLKQKWQTATRTFGIVSSHQHHRRHLLKQRGEPFGGVFYWAPGRNDEWSLYVYPDPFYENNEATFEAVWSDQAIIVAKTFGYEAEAFTERFGVTATSFPRGRVKRTGDSAWCVSVGCEGLPPGDRKALICEAFCLPVGEGNVAFEQDTGYSADTSKLLQLCS